MMACVGWRGPGAQFEVASLLVISMAHFPMAVGEHGTGEVHEGAESVLRLPTTVSPKFGPVVVFRAMLHDARSGFYLILSGFYMILCGFHVMIFGFQMIVSGFFKI